MKEEQDIPVKAIAETLKVSEPRVYQLVSRARAIIQEYYADND